MLSSPNLSNIKDSGRCFYCKKAFILGNSQTDFHTCPQNKKPCMRLWRRSEADSGTRIWFYQADISNIRFLNSFNFIEVNKSNGDELLIPKFDIFQFNYQELYSKVKKLMVFI
jgi:hypothetical protein